MHDNGDLTQHYSNRMMGAGAISALIRAADDADWELDEALQFNQPFDPFADDPE